MPCVFPVLSIKAVGLLRAGESRATARAHGLLYGLGVLVSFWLLAGTLLALRAGGAQLGWGFQLQSPTRVFGLALLLFLMGLNLAGAFEIRASWVGIGHGLASRREGLGAFFSGVLATLVATPCTAPFMGSALGFAATQPPVVALAVFTALAVGLAAPYVLLAWFPGFGRCLPKPGRWMETVKQVMAFPLFATVIWLLWVLAQQAGANAVVTALGAFLLAAFAAWIYERWPARLGTAAAALTLVGAAAIGATMIAGAPDRPGAALGAASTAASESSGWEPFSQRRLDALRADGKPVFVDFTAAWCVTCKVNEAVALGPTMLRTMRERGVTTLQGDWTNEDAEITAALRSFGRDGVPLYLLYGAKNTAPKILPQILSPAIVLAALDELNPTAHTNQEKVP
jgi:thiol:disulfide interchange protein DsbD